jgi:urea carboxylase
VCIRQAGEDNLLVEFGPPVLDIALRFHVQGLLEWLRATRIHGLIDLTPGIRSLQIHFDSRHTNQRLILDLLLYAIEQLPDIEAMELPSRIVHLPLSWDDPATQLAIARYTQSVRPDAPWCPSNIEFIRRINGLESVDQVREIVFNANYLVMGLGDVYLGAPVATPLDPRHRLVTTKYNPARTWTPENAVGIGGAYMCVYGMEGPGGYQFVGRTIQMWNRYRQTADFEKGKPWLLRFFDQIRFHPVDAARLTELREQLPYGRYSVHTEPATLSLRAYRQFLDSNAASIASFRERQRNAFDEERERWRIAGQNMVTATEVAPPAAIGEVPADCIGVSSPVAGSVWQLRVEVGRYVKRGDELLVLEAMKMEIAVAAEESGTIVELRCAAGRAVTAGDTLVVIRPDKASG